VHNLSFGDWDLVIFLALVPLVVNEIIKAIARFKESD
jgi:hypothetical protein